MEDWIVKQKIRIPYRYTAGKAISRFLQGLAECKLLGTRCDTCSRVYLPPLGFCGRCWKEITHWLDVLPEGELLSYTLTPDGPLGLIRIDGVDSTFVHRLGGVDQTQLEGMTRVRAVWRQEREGAISDITHFEPVGTR